MFDLKGGSIQCERGSVRVTPPTAGLTCQWYWCVSNENTTVITAKLQDAARFKPLMIIPILLINNNKCSQTICQVMLFHCYVNVTDNLVR